MGIWRGLWLCEDEGRTLGWNVGGNAGSEVLG